MPTITVVTPSFNQASYLEETLRSVISQQDHVHEYFVLDGGSTDGSVEIIKRYRSRIDYWTSEKDRGQSDAIHKGFQRATGDVLLWLNSDDVLLPGALLKIRQAFERHPNWDVVSGYHAQIDADSRILSFQRIPMDTRCGHAGASCTSASRHVTSVAAFMNKFAGSTLAYSASWTMSFGSECLRQELSGVISRNS